MFALVDCNNFFVSCEKVFNPKLKGPILVLSSNDGCVVARSAEAKKIGIPMGAPAFLHRDLFMRHKVKVFSSNFSLYSDMSRRVMETLETFTPDLQIYSVDEAFLFFPALKSKNELSYIRERVLQWTGLPVSIGFSKTKTLSKVANHYAKKSKEGVVILGSDAEIEGALIDLPVEDIWGVGHKTASWLHSQSIYTAKELRDVDDNWIRKHLSVVMLRLVWELRGMSNLPLEEVAAPRQSTVCSRTFGERITELEPLLEAVATFTASAAETIREEGSIASHISVFIVGHERVKERFPYFESGITLREATSYTPTLITAAKELTQKLYRPNTPYRKAGVLLSGLIAKEALQLDLFSTTSSSQRKKQERVMTLMDQMNQEYGKQVLRPASTGSQKERWRRKADSCSPRYTTSWNEILEVH